MADISALSESRMSRMVYSLGRCFWAFSIMPNCIQNVGLFHYPIFAIARFAKPLSGSIEATDVEAIKQSLAHRHTIGSL